MDIFKLVGSVFVDTEKANDSLSKVDKKAEGTGGKLGKLIGAAGKVGIGIATGVAAGATALFKLAEGASESLDAVQKGAQKLEMSYEEYQKLSYACDRAGMSIQSFKKGMVNINGDLADFANGSEKASETYAKFGVSLANADGSLKTSEQVLNETLYALADMEDQTQRNALAQEVFGKSYTEMLPLLNQGAEGIQQLMQNAEELGLVMSDDAVEAGAKFKDQLDDLKASFSQVGVSIGAELMPFISGLMDLIMQAMPTIQSVIKFVVGLVQQILSALQPVVDFIKSHSTEISAVFSTLGSIIQATIGAAIEMIGTFIQTIVSIGVNAKAVVTEVSTAFKNIWNTVSGIVTKLKDVFNFKWSLPQIKLPHFAVTPAGWKIGDLLKGTIPSLSVRWYKKAMDNAMVLDNPTIFGASNGSMLGAGEAGREVVSGEAHLMEMIREASNNGSNTEMLNVLIRLSNWITDGGLEDTIADVIEERLRVKWHDRELMRMVKNYA